MDKDIFDKEISICQAHFKKNDGRCKWGVCDKCGVIPLLYKVYKNKLYDDVQEIADLKHEIFE